MNVQKRRRGMTPRWFLYILECSDGSLYTGITTDLERRVAQHNKGTASRYTRSRLPVRLLHAERCRNRSEALKRECRIKALDREKKLGYLAGDVSLAKTLDIG